MPLTQLSIKDDILELTDEGPRLIGMRCKDCDNYVFPYQQGCSRCTGNNVEQVRLGTKGKLWAWTVQGFPPKAPPILRHSHTTAASLRPSMRATRQYSIERWPGMNTYRKRARITLRSTQGSARR